MQNEFHNFLDIKYKIMKFILHLDRILTEMILCHPIEISKSLECFYQSSQFMHHCKGKFMTYLEMAIIFSRFFLFLKYSPIPWLHFFFDSPGTHTYIHRDRFAITISPLLFKPGGIKNKNKQINKQTKNKQTNKQTKKKSYIWQNSKRL